MLCLKIFCIPSAPMRWRKQKGSTFYFTIPHRLKQTKETDGENEVLNDKATEKKKLKILIADDDECNSCDLTVKL